jgi:glutamine synthetase
LAISAKLGRLACLYNELISIGAFHMTIKEKILSAVKENNIRFIDLWFTDILGIIKSVTVPASKLESVIVHGSHFDGSSIDGFARVAESDMELHPDLNTFRILPWTSDKYPTARLICNVYTWRSQNSLNQCPRRSEPNGVSVQDRDGNGVFHPER